MSHSEVTLNTPLNGGHLDPGDDVNVLTEGVRRCTIKVGEGTSEAKLVNATVTTTVSNRLTPMEIFRKLAEANMKRMTG